MQKELMIIVLVYYVIINLWGYFSMWSDKRKAIKGKYRTPEKKLFLIAILGGSLGSIMGMQKFRHKTKHWYFKYGMPAILVIQIVLIFFAANTLIKIL